MWEHYFKINVLILINENIFVVERRKHQWKGGVSYGSVRKVIPIQRQQEACSDWAFTNVLVKANISIKHYLFVLCARYSDITQYFSMKIRYRKSKILSTAISSRSEINFIFNLSPSTLHLDRNKKAPYMPTMKSP